MLPSQAINNHGDKSTGHLVLTCKSFVGNPTFRSNSHHAYLGFCQDGLAVKTPARSKEPAFSHSVLDIFSLRSEEQMRGPNTEGVVAFMEHEQAVWNRAFPELPRNSTSNLCLPIKAERPIVGSPVLPFETACIPPPASSGFSHLTQETRFHSLHQLRFLLSKVSPRNP